VTGALVLANAGLRLLTEPALLQEAKDEFAGRKTSPHADRTLTGAAAE